MQGATVLEDLLGHPSLAVIDCPVVNSGLFVALLVDIQSDIVSDAASKDWL